MTSSTQAETRPTTGFHTSQTMPVDQSLSVRFDLENIKIYTYSGHGSLNKIEDDETTLQANTEVPAEPKKKSAFGFISKQPIKPQTNEAKPNQGLSFVSNTNVGRTDFYDASQGNNSGLTTENYDHESHQENQSATNFAERRQSLSSNASEPVNTGPPKPTAFGFISKKVSTKLYLSFNILQKQSVQIEPESQHHQYDNQISNLNNNQTSLNLDASMHNEMESGITSSDTRSESCPFKEFY